MQYNLIVKISKIKICIVVINLNTFSHNSIFKQGFLLITLPKLCFFSGQIVNGKCFFANPCNIRTWSLVGSPAFQLNKIMRDQWKIYYILLKITESLYQSNKIQQLQGNINQSGSSIDTVLTQRTKLLLLFVWATFIIIQFMLADPCGKFQRLVSQLLLDQNYKFALEKGLRLYKIRQFNVVQLQPNKILQMFYEISNKFYSSRLVSNLQPWHQNQLKIFIWALIGYSFLQKRCISLMDQSDWTFFSQIFKGRSSRLLEYQALTLLKKQSKPLKWSQDQINLLQQIIKKNSKKNKWNQTAKNLYLASEKKYFRTAKQCREYWINHLDPIPVKSSWSNQQDLELITLAYDLDKKWSKVSKKLEGRRTEHMVKNRFNSLYHFQLKRYTPEYQQKANQRQVMKNLQDRLRQLIQDEKGQKHFLKTMPNFQVGQQKQFKNPDRKESINLRQLDEAEFPALVHASEFYEAQIQSRIYNDIQQDRNRKDSFSKRITNIHPDDNQSFIANFQCSNILPSYLQYFPAENPIDILDELNYEQRIFK